MQFFVAHHDPAMFVRTWLPDTGVRFLNLPELPLAPGFRDNKFAESRALLWLAENPHYIENGYVALLHASYGEKFRHLAQPCDFPTRLEPHMSKHRVVGPLLCDNYMIQAEACHPGMAAILSDILAEARIEVVLRRTVMSNSIIAHSDVWHRFLPDWYKLFHLALPHIDPIRYDTTYCKPGVAPAYLLERLTAAWFAAQPDLCIYPLVTRLGIAYYSLNDNGPMVHPKGFGGDPDVDLEAW